MSTIDDPITSKIDEVAGKFRTANPPARPTLQAGGKHRIGDLLTDRWGNPLISSADRYSPRGRAVLNFEIDDNLPEADRSAILGAVAQSLPQHTLEAAAASRSKRGLTMMAAHESTDAAANPYTGYQRAPAAVRLLEQATAGQAGAFPSINNKAYSGIGPDVRETVPPPSTFPEKVARAAGGLPTMIGEIALLKKIPFLAPQAEAGIAGNAARAGAIGAGVQGAQPAGDAWERGINAATGFASFAATEAIPSAVYRGAMRRSGPALTEATQKAVTSSQAASRAAEIADAAKGQPLSAADRATVEQLARGTGERAGAAASALAAEEAQAMTTAGRAAHATSLVAAPLIFGPIQAYTQQALMHATGHPVEMPKASDLFGAKAVEDVAVLGVLSALGARGGFDRVRPAEPTTEPLPGETAAGGTPALPAREGNISEMLAALPKETRPAEAEKGMAAVRAIRAQFDGRPANPYAGGALARDTFDRQFNRALIGISQEKGVSVENLTAEDHRAAAVKAAGVTNGFEAIRATMEPPKIPLSDPDRTRKLNFAEQATARANELIANKPLEMSLDVAGKQITGPVTILRLEVWPWLKTDSVRAFLRDDTSGGTAALSFNNIADLAARIRMPAPAPAPASAEPVARLQTSRMVPRTGPSTTGEQLARAAQSGLAAPEPPKALPRTAATSLDPETLWRGGKLAVDELAHPENAHALWSAARLGAKLPRRAGELLHEAQVLGIRLTEKKVREMAVRNRDPNLFTAALHRRLLNGLEGRVRELGTTSPATKPSLERKPTPVAKGTDPVANEVVPPERGEAGTAVPPQASTTAAPDVSRGDRTATPAVTVHKTTAVGTTQGAATHYTRSSGERVAIVTMQSPHLRNAEAKAAQGAEKSAMRAEITRRGLKPKEGPDETPPAAPAVRPAFKPVPGGTGAARPAAVRPAAPARPAPAGRGAGEGRPGAAASARQEEMIPSAEGATAEARVTSNGTRIISGSIMPEPAAKNALSPDDVTRVHSVLDTSYRQAGIPLERQIKLMEHQVHNVGMAMQAFDDKNAIAIADSTGTGKTVTGIVMALEAERRFGAANKVVVAPNQQLLETWRREGAMFGLDVTDALTTGGEARPGKGKIVGITYATLRLRKGDLGFDPDLVIFDEAHKGMGGYDPGKTKFDDQPQSAAAMILARRSKYRAFMTATPMSTPLDFAYMGEFMPAAYPSFAAMLTQLGIRFDFGESRWYGLTKEKLLELHERLVRAGVYTRTEMIPDDIKNRWDEPVRMHVAPIMVGTAEDTASKYNRAADIIDAYRMELRRRYNTTGARIVGAQRTAILRAIVEEGRVQDALAIGDQKLAQGFSVAYFVERLEGGDFENKQSDSAVVAEVWGRLGRAGIKHASPVDLLRRHYLSRGQRVSEITGKTPAGSTTRQAGVDAFQSGESKVAVVTFAAGGTGLSLHDLIGNHPRFGILIQTPYDANTGIQTLGRLFRLGSQSNAQFAVLSTVTPTDKRYTSRFLRRVKAAGYIVRGDESQIGRHTDVEFDYPEEMPDRIGKSEGMSAEEVSQRANMFAFDKAAADARVAVRAQRIAEAAPIPGEAVAGDRVEVHGIVEHKNDGKRGRVVRRVATTSSSGNGSGLELQLDSGGTIYVGKEEVAQIPGEKGAPLEQATLPGMPAPAMPASAIATNGAAAQHQVARLGEEAQTYEQAFEQLIRAGSPDAEAALDAHVLSGQREPADFDAAAAARSIRRRILEEVGQQDIFGGALMLGSEGRVGSSGAPAGALSDIAERPDLISSEAAEREVGDRTLVASDIRTNEVFQQRDTGADLVNHENLQTLLERWGGFSMEQMKLHPPTVWVDSLGELGVPGDHYVIDGHHRQFLAMHNWAKDASTGKWVMTGTSDRKIPVKVIGGSLESAKERALLANQAGVANTLSERAKIAHATGEPKKAATQLGVKESEATRLINFYGVDADLRAAYFPPGAEDQYLSWKMAATLGAHARANPALFTKAVQESFLRRAVADDQTLGQFGAAIDDWLKEIAHKLPPEVLLKSEVAAQVMPSEWGAATGKLVYDVDTSLAQARKTLTGIIAQYQPAGVTKLKDGASASAMVKFIADHKNELPAHAISTMRDIQRKLQLLQATRDDVGKRRDSLLKKIIAGEPVGEDIAAIKAFITEKLGTPIRRANKALGEAAEKAPLGVGFGALDPVGEWFWQRVLSGRKAAQDWFVRRQGRAARHVTVKVEGTGETVAKYEIKANDLASEEPLYRFGATSNLMGAMMTLPPGLREEAIVAQAGRDYLSHMAYEMFIEAAGPNLMVDAPRLDPRAGGLTDALEKKDTPAGRVIAAKYAKELEAIRGVFNELRTMAVQVAKAEGIKPPGFIEHYFPHMRGQPAAAPIDHLAEFFYGRALDAKELRDVTNRFFEHREGDQNYQRDPWIGIEAYIRAWSRWMALIPYLARAKQVLSSEWAKGDPQRARATRDMVKEMAFPQDDALTQMLNDHARSIFYTKTAGGVVTITAAEAASYLGKKVTDLLGTDPKNSALDRFAYVAKGASASFSRPNAWRKLGETKHGAVWGGVDGHAFNATMPEMIRPLEAALRYATKLRIGAMKKPRPEAIIAEVLRARERVARHQNKPATAGMAWFSRRILKALIGYSTASIFQNSTQVLTHVMPEYGFRAALEGASRYGRASKGAVIRAAADYFEHLHYIDPATATSWRAASKMYKEELYPEATGTRQGQAEQQHDLAQRIESGEHEIDARLHQVLFSGLGAYGVIETVVRGMSAMIASSAGARLGHTQEQVQNMIEADGKARRKATLDIMGSIRDPKSVAWFMANHEYFTNFYYNLLGQHIGMAKPWMRYVVGQLSTFPASTLVLRELRDLFGVGRVAAAGVRNLLGKGPATRPRMKGSTQESGVYEAPKLGTREPYGGSKSRFGSWWQKGGATWQARWSAKSFMRTMLVSGAMLMLSDVLHINLMGLYTPFATLGLLWLLRAFFPENAFLQRSMKRAESGLVYRFIGPYLGITGPIPTMWARYTEGKSVGEILWNSTFGFLGGLMRMLILGSLHRATRGALETFPEVFDNDKLRWVYDVMGQRTALYGLDPGQKIQNTLGILDPDVVASARRPIHPKAGAALLPKLSTGPMHLAPAL